MDATPLVHDGNDTQDRARARPCAAPDLPAMHAAHEAWPSEDERLCASARQALLTPRGRLGLVLRLSALPPPLPRPHHRRIATTILEQAARLHDGEAFELSCGDIVLLCRISPGEERDGLHPADLPGLLARLLRADVAPTHPLTTVWDLEREGTALLAYTAALQG